MTGGPGDFAAPPAPAFIADLQALTTGLRLCEQCSGVVQMEVAPAPLLLDEQVALAAIGGERRLPPWLPEGVCVAVCNSGHVNFAPGTDVASARRAAADYHRLLAKDHLTGSERTRLRRAFNRLGRLHRSQIECQKRIQKRWEDMASRIKTVEFTTLNVTLPIEPEDLADLGKPYEDLTKP